jgi:nucleoside-diphosphate-sugar epimerase
MQTIEIHSVTVLARKSSDFHLIEDLDYNVAIGDLVNLNSLHDVIPDETEWLFHNAAIMADWGSKKKYFPVNVEGTRHILEIVRRKDVPKLVHTSSTGVYGFPNTEEPLREGDPYDPSNAYQESKVEAEKLIKEYESEYGFKASMVRAPVVLGNGDMFTTPQLIEFAKDGGMVLFSGGRNTQTYAHVEDFASCLILAAENMTRAAGNAYNVGSFTCKYRELAEALTEELGLEQSFRDYPYSVAVGLGVVAERLYRAFNRKNAPLLTSFRVKMFGTEYVVDYSKAQKELGYEPKWGLESTVKDMVEWGGFVKPR